MLRRDRLPALMLWLLAAVCLAPLAAQDFGAAAKVLVLTGRVSVLRDGTEWALNVGSPVQPKQIVITGPDGYAKFQLSDGSTFEVFQNSKTVFRATSSSDLIDLLIGRVKVYIQHRNGPNPNRVTTQTAVISVRGTVFDVVAEDEDTTFVSVDEGVVNVRHALFGDQKDLFAGDSIRVYREQRLARAIDRGNAARMALRAAAQAVYDAMVHRPAGGGAGSPGPTGGTGQGDTGKGTGTGDTGNTGSTGGNAPPPPPPPPPPSNP
ncbi:MAG: hypothetical protein C5B51_03305 [Terriglobia bacterium]|nr:MAG: hypothetical protein C5B51_03305 [Terriglobia bacterium]